MHADAVIPSRLCPSQRKDVKPHYYQATKPELCDTIITKESSPISTLKLVHTENTSAKWDHLNIVQQRADAFESILELYAKLLEERLDELADIFRPFGERVMSSREMSIQRCLTMSLMTPPKF
jgi:NIMA (never in mitosis gene a)-related kinase 1/4/5